MRSHLLWCMGGNIVATLFAAGLLYLYPSESGFTFTSPKATQFVQGGPLLAALVMICASSVVAVYLAFRVYKAL